MKFRNLIPFVFLVVLNQSGFSQETEHPDTLLSGLKGLVFTFSGFNLGGGLGGKFWIDDSRVLRLTLNGSFRKVTDESPPSTYDHSSSQLGITVGIAQRFLKTRVVSPYVGVAVEAAKSWETIERADTSGIDTDRYSTTAIGGNFHLGVEYWFVNNISLSGEQSVSIAYTKYPDSKSFRIGNATSQLLLSVYF